MEPHGLIFSSVISLDARMDIIRATIEWLKAHKKDEAAGHDFVKEWNSLKEKIRKHYKSRNGVAHSCIYHSKNPDGSLNTCDL
jgi:hypothetical protein